MPLDPERHARLYYDRSCGPCTFLAGAVQGLSHGRVVSAPLDGERSEEDLGDLSAGERYGSAHVVVVGAPRRTGAEIVGPLVGLALGPTADRLFERLPVLDRPFRGLYRLFWDDRRRSGGRASPPA
ncbi:MAG: hypothetical protein WAK40_00750 [Thermoplasmata archaeon]